MSRSRWPAGATPASPARVAPRRANHTRNSPCALLFIRKITCLIMRLGVGPAYFLCLRRFLASLGPFSCYRKALIHSLSLLRNRIASFTFCELHSHSFQCFQYEIHTPLVIRFYQRRIRLECDAVCSRCCSSFCFLSRFGESSWTPNASHITDMTVV